jgi:membrane-bound lytic murein transglycosylase D
MTILIVTTRGCFFMKALKKYIYIFTNKKSFIVVFCLFFLFSQLTYSETNNYDNEIDDDEINELEAFDDSKETDDSSSEKISISENSDDSVNTKISNAVSKALKNKKTSSSISAAEYLYERALKHFEEKDFVSAGKYLNAFLKKIARSGIEPEIYFFIFEDIENMLTKLKRIYGADSVQNFYQNKDYSIQMTTEDDSLTEKYILEYSSGKAKERIRLALERSGKYSDIVLKALQDFGLPKELFYLPIVESLYNANAVSRAGAVGMWQIMPHRGRALGLKINYWIDERKDPEKSTQAACLYLKQLYLMLNDWHLVLAAYNRGEYGLIRDMKFSNATNVTEMVSRRAVPKETQNYVPQFIAMSIIGKNLKKYGFDNLTYEQPVKYDKYKTDKVIDLKVIAKCAETTVDEIKKLNPSLIAWRTPHGYPDFEIKIPFGSKEKFVKNLKEVKDLNPTTEFIKHKVLQGEYLGKIANMYKTTVNEICIANNIGARKTIKAGQVLAIRPGKNYFK